MADHLHNNHANSNGNDEDVDDVSSPIRRQQKPIHRHLPIDAAASSISISGDETPPRRITEVDPIIVSAGMPTSSSSATLSWEPLAVHRKSNRTTKAAAAAATTAAYPILARSKSNGSTRSRNEESVTSSVMSVKSGLLVAGGRRQRATTRPEDLEGLIVQTTPSQDDLDGNEEEEDSSLPITTSSVAATAAREKSQMGQLQLLLLDLKHHLDKTMIELRDQSRRDFEKVLAILQQESAKRTDLEQRLHSQLLLQSENMVAMELKLLRLEAKVERREAALRQQRRTPTVSILEETPAELGIRSNSSNGTSRPLVMATRPGRSGGPSNIAVITSGASLASGVTAGSFLADGEDNSMDKNSDADGDVEDEGEDEGDTLVEEDAQNDESHSTPTQGSRHRPTFQGGETLDSILLNPMVGESLSTSVRATRGETDGNSSLATSVTGSTITSTVVTATTRGDSVNVRSNRFINDPDAIVALEGAETPTRVHPMTRGDVTFGASPDNEARLPRSRSQSPLTVQSSTMASEALSMASNSIGNSILSTAAVAPSRSFGTRRAAAAAAGASAHMDNRPIANRVVSFTTDILNQTNQFSEAGDSITMPDELDNLSDIADAFAASARSWREEYEARLDALQKRWAAE